MKDNWSDYWQYKCAQMVKKYKHTYLVSKGKVPLFTWAGYDGIDNNVWIPQSYEEWLKYKKENEL
jgi:hypothetical protein